MTQKEEYFVRVKTPDLLRVSLLESSKLFLHAQQSYYKIISMRKRKDKANERLKLQTKELTLLLTKLENLLPYPELADGVAKRNNAKRKPTNSVKETIQAQTSTSFAELDKLNRSLANIEEKLNKLS